MIFILPTMHAQLPRRICILRVMHAGIYRSICILRVMHAGMYQSMCVLRVMHAMIRGPNNNNNHFVTWQRRLEKWNSYIASLCAQGCKLRRPTSTSVVGKTFPMSLARNERFQKRQHLNKPAFFKIHEKQGFRPSNHVESIAHMRYSRDSS